MNTILIVDDQIYIRMLIAKALAKEGYRVNDLACVERIWECIHNHQPDLVLLGLHPESYDCWKILDEAQKEVPDLPILIYVVRCFNDIHSLKLAINEVLGNKLFSFDDHLSYDSCLSESHEPLYHKTLKCL